MGTYIYKTKPGIVNVTMPDGEQVEAVKMVMAFKPYWDIWDVALEKTKAPDYLGDSDKLRFRTYRQAIVASEKRKGACVVIYCSDDGKLKEGLDVYKFKTPQTMIYDNDIERSLLIGKLTKKNRKWTVSPMQSGG